MTPIEFSATVGLGAMSGLPVLFCVWWLFVFDEEGAGGWLILVYLVWVVAFVMGVGTAPRLVVSG